MFNQVFYQVFYRVFNQVFNRAFSKITLFIFSIITVLGLYYYLPHNFYFHAAGQSKTTKTIGIIVPMEHGALTEIVKGFQDTIKDVYGEVNIKVKNAEGDINIQRSIIQQYLNQDVDVIVPIGTATTLMTQSMVKEKPIVSLAAFINGSSHSENSSNNITGVLDEIGAKKPLDFIQAVYPNMKKITLIYSASEKIYPEVQELSDYSQTKNIVIQKLMVQSLPELYQISKHIAKDSDAIFILKDHLIVSGIQTLIQEAHNRKIPLIASDEGSVKAGAHFALGVKERAIGEEGALLAGKVLSGTNINQLPLQVLNKLSVFYHKDLSNTDHTDLTDHTSDAEHAQQSNHADHVKQVERNHKRYNIDMITLKKAANTLGYEFVIVEGQ